MQETQVQSLVSEGPTGLGATKPVGDNLLSQDSRARALQQEEPLQ